MKFELLILNGYGQFVWPAFMFTFVILLFLFFRIKKEFTEYEKAFLREFNHSQITKIRVAEKERTTKEVLSSSSI